jgi:hypothetical protein
MRLGGSPFYATFHACESLVRAGYADTPTGLRMTQVYEQVSYAALAHVHITQGRVVRLCVTRAVHLVLHSGFVHIINSGKPRYARYVWGRNPSTLFWDSTIPRIPPVVRARYPGRRGDESSRAPPRARAARTRQQAANKL